MKLIYLAPAEGSVEPERLPPEVEVRADGAARIESGSTRDRVLNCSARASRGGGERVAITRLEWVAYPRQDNVEEGKLSAAVAGPNGDERYRLLLIRSAGERNQGNYRCRAVNSRGLDAESTLELEFGHQGPAPSGPLRSFPSLYFSSFGPLGAHTADRVLFARRVQVSGRRFGSRVRSATRAPSNAAAPSRSRVSRAARRKRRSRRSSGSLRRNARRRRSRLRSAGTTRAPAPAWRGSSASPRSMAKIRACPTHQ